MSRPISRAASTPSSSRPATSPTRCRSSCVRQPHDVFTDHDLHADGAALLDGYRVLITGTHPEYWTHAMLDALHGWLERGGRLMYLGGNGFYWVTSIDPDRPHVAEVRRGIN